MFISKNIQAVFRTMIDIDIIYLNAIHVLVDHFEYFTFHFFDTISSEAIV